MKDNLASINVKERDRKFYKKTFEKTSEDRRQRIFNTAYLEFASNGYNATSINDIAKKAGISIGALYSYFASKEDLFLAIVENNFNVLESALKDIAAEGGNIFEIYKKMLLKVREHAKDFPEMNQIYLDITTQGLALMSKRLSNKIESISAEFYRKIIRKAKQEGHIRKDIDDGIAAYCMDNIIMVFQFSLSSDYYKERMKIFIGNDALKNEEAIIEGIMDFVKKALS